MSKFRVGVFTLHSHTAFTPQMQAINNFLPAQVVIAADGNPAWEVSEAIARYLSRSNHRVMGFSVITSYFEGRKEFKGYSISIGDYSSLERKLFAWYLLDSDVAQLKGKHLLQKSQPNDQDSVENSWVKCEDCGDYPRLVCEECAYCVECGCNCS